MGLLAVLHNTSDPLCKLTELPLLTSLTVCFFSQGGDLANWDDWGQNDSGLISVKVESSNQNEANPEQNNPEVDIFGDMQPVFQKTKKVRLC